MTQDTVEANLTLLRSGHDREEIAWAMEDLARTTDGAAALVTMLADVQELRIARMRAAQALSMGGVRRGRRAVGPLVAALSDPDTEVQGSAIWSLGRIGDARALPELDRIASPDAGAAMVSATGRHRLSDKAARAVAAIRDRVSARGKAASG